MKAPNLSNPHILSRRRFIAGVLSFPVLVPAQVAAHTPYKQWSVYRQKHLLIGCHKDNPQSYDVAKMVVKKLDTNLPAASARVARAPVATRLASLLSTEQLNVAILEPQIAIAMAEGSGKFAAFGPIDLKILLPLEQFWLVGHSRLKDHHSWQVTRALESMKGAFSPSDFKTVSWHPGSSLYLEGKAIPSHD